MKRLDWKCSNCGVIRTTYSSSPPACQCGKPMTRQYTFGFIRPMPAHYNVALGRVVTSQRDFLDGLKRASDAQSERTGIYHNYQPVDVTDHKSLGVDLSHLDNTHRQEVKEGKREVKKFYS